MLNPNIIATPRGGVAQMSERDTALVSAMKLYAVPIIGFFRHRINDCHIAQDLAQELWVSVSERFSVSQFTDLSLLFHRADQILCDHLRRPANRVFAGCVSEVPEREADGNWGSGSDEEEERAKALFWERFPGAVITQQQKDAFWLKYYRGHTLEEIAVLMRTPPSTVHGWIERLKKDCAESFNNNTQ